MRAFLILCLIPASFGSLPKLAPRDAARKLQTHLSLTFVLPRHASVVSRPTLDPTREQGYVQLSGLEDGLIAAWRGLWPGGLPVWTNSPCANRRYGVTRLVEG